MSDLHFTIGPAPPDTVLGIYREYWNGDVIYTPRGVFGVADVEAFQAVDRNDRLIGLISFAIGRRFCDIISINALIEGFGVGTALLDAVVETARSRGAASVILTQTNDNLRAFAFYQKRGFRLVALRPRAMEAVREKKPAIPLTAPNGIPIRDYIDLELDL